MIQFFHLIVFILSFCFVYIYVHFYRVYVHVRNIPTIPFNIIWPLYQINMNAKKYFDIFNNIQLAHDGLSKFWLGPKLAIVCDEPSLIHTILMSKECIEKPYLYRMIVGAGNGIFSSKGIAFAIVCFKWFQLIKFCSSKHMAK